MNLAACGESWFFTNVMGTICAFVCLEGGAIGRATVSDNTNNSSVSSDRAETLESAR